MTTEYEIRVKRSKRKTASIYVERDGSLSVLVPEKTTEQEIEDILKVNEYKIQRYRARREILNESVVRREPVNGQSYLYLGRNYYLQHSSTIDEIELRGRYLWVPEETSERLNALLKRFYRSRGTVFLPPRVKRYAEKMGLSIEKVSVQELRYRWASCSVEKLRVNLHWKVMMAPVSVIDYLIVHELTHVVHKRHNSDFWNTIDKVLPNYQKQVAWLKDYGASLDL